MSSKKSKYKVFDSRIKELLRDGFSSDKIAQMINEENPTAKVNVASMARQVRRAYGSPDNLKRKPKAKILLFDIETAPITAYTWGIWNQNIGQDMILKDWFVLSWSAKWLFDDEIYNMSLTPKEIDRGDDKRIIKGIWQMLHEADVVVAHNLKKFDKKRVQTRFLKYDMGLPSPYNTVDTLLHARKQFAITSNRLDYIASKFLGIEGKMETPKGLWWDCMKGDKDAMKTMVEYCDKDVKVLEDVYLTLRPYIQPHPNIGLIDGGGVHCCPTCGGTDLKPFGTYRTYVNEFDVYSCNECKSISRARKNSTPKEVKDTITVSVPQQ